MRVAGIRQRELSDKELLGGGVDVRQFGLTESFLSAAPPAHFMDQAGMDNLITVARRALEVLENPTPELGVRIRFVSGIVPDESGQKPTPNPDSRLMTVVRQMGDRHPFVLHERPISKGGFGPDISTETLGYARKRAVASWLGSNITLFESRRELADPIKRIGHLEAQVQQLRKDFDTEPVPILSLFGFSVIRNRNPSGR